MKAPPGLAMIALSDEEKMIMACARGRPMPPAEVESATVNWDRVVTICELNQLAPLLTRWLKETSLWESVTPAAKANLKQAAEKASRNGALLGDSLRDYLRIAADRGIETAVLKGLSLSVDLYGDAGIRPGGDIDLLVRQGDVDASLEILEEMGIGRNWPNLMDDRYYERHHLHQQRCTPDLLLWYEIHWALDHPLTRLTIDYEGMMNRTTAGSLLGAPVQDLTCEDNLIALAVHLVKHAVYLPAAAGRADLARVIMADGTMLNLVDIAELIKRQRDAIDWQLLIERCRQYGATTTVGSALRACHELLDGPVPDWVLKALPISPPGPLKRWMMAHVVEYRIDRHLGNPPSRLWQFLLVTNGAFILRPIRLLDLAAYTFPGRDYLGRRYGSAGPGAAAWHFLRALAQQFRAGVDTLYFIWERYWRLRRMNYRTSLANRLEVEL